MRKSISYEKAQAIMGRNFIGVEQLVHLSQIQLSIPFPVPDIPYSDVELEDKKEHYLLILGVSKLADGRDVTIRNIINIFGKDPSVSEPCFYNQDWYEKEQFIDSVMENRWFMIRKNVYEDSRAVQPADLLYNHQFPSAIKCIYSFITAWMALDVKLWYCDFIWCSDVDHNGDRIYVGKYHDIDGINRNGFSIHRHLALRACYGCIDFC